MNQTIARYACLLLVTLSMSATAQQQTFLAENILPAGQCEHFPYTNKIYLYQNYPNPMVAGQATVIRYQAVDALSVAIYVYDAAGHVVKQFNNLAPGIHAVTMEANTLRVGEYKYKLFVNERMVARRKLVVTPELFGVAVDNFQTY